MKMKHTTANATSPIGVGKTLIFNVLRNLKLSLLNFLLPLCLVGMAALFVSCEKYDPTTDDTTRSSEQADTTQTTITLTVDDEWDGVKEYSF